VLGAQAIDGKAQDGRSSVYAQFGSTTSPLELSWQTVPTALYPAGHCNLAADCAVAVTDRRLTAKRASVSLRILWLQLVWFCDNAPVGWDVAHLRM